MRKELPTGWAHSPLSEACDIILGQSPPSSVYNTDNTGLPFYQGKAEFGSIHPTPEKWCSSPKKIAQQGDVLISVRAPVGPTNICLEESCIGRGLAAIRGLGGIQTYFVLYALRAHEEVIAGKGNGTTFNAITGDSLKSFTIPIPPLPEQRRIVAKIEELFTRLDAGIEALKKVKAQLKTYRQSVLKHAFDGKLTADWREAHKHELEPASVLLERVKQEGKKKLKGKYREFPPVETSGLPELPDGWEWTTTDHLFWFVTSGSRGWAKYYSETGPTFLRIGNLDHASISLDLSNIQHVNPPKGTEGIRTRIVPGDILVSITADVGMIALVPTGIKEAYINQHISLARSSSLFNRAYLAWYLASNDGGQKQFRKLQRGATKVGLGLDDIKAINVPLPALSEQSKIIEEIERHFSIINEAECAIDHSLMQADRLRQSILKRAFEGKLVTQDPNDEPPEKLLGRIKAERTKQNTKKRTTTRKKSPQME